MSADLLQFERLDDDVAFEPELEPSSGELALEPDAEAPVTTVALDARADTSPSPAAVLPIAELLPPDFRLSPLVKFIPNPALRTAVDDASTYALSIAVEGAAGLQRADLALTALRTSLNAIEDHFAEPAALAYELHKNITARRAEWQTTGQAALKTVGNRVYTEKKRLDDLAAEERRKAQAEADRQAKETARREAEAAERAKAPAPIVEELKRQAETATAPPVQSTAAAAPAMRGSTTVTTWKARIIGTSGADEPNPKMADLNPEQRAHVLKLMRAVVDGAAPMSVFELNWSTMNARAKSDKSTLSLPGIEAFDDGSLRAKAQRGR